MPSTGTLTTMRKMIDSLPEEVQEQVLDHMREYIEDIRDEARWRKSFSRTGNRLAAAARQARKEIAGGKAAALDLKRL